MGLVYSIPGSDSSNETKKLCYANSFLFGIGCSIAMNQIITRFYSCIHSPHYSALLVLQTYFHCDYWFLILAVEPFRKRILISESKWNSSVKGDAIREQYLSSRL
jgi:hypothetical protein